jgi:hypothetical protein
MSTAVDWSRVLAAPAPDPAAESARAAMNELALVSAEVFRLKAEATKDAERTRGPESRKPQAESRKPEAGSQKLETASWLRGSMRGRAVAGWQ